MSILPDSTFDHDRLVLVQYDPFIERFGRCVFPSSVTIGDDFCLSVKGEFSKCDLILALSTDLKSLQHITVTDGVIRSDFSFLLIHLQLLDTPRFILDFGSNLSIMEPSYRSIQFPINTDSLKNDLYLLHKQSELILILDVSLLIYSYE